MDRRELLAVGSVGVLLAGARAMAQSGAGAESARVIRIYATPDGGSAVEDVTISATAGPVPVTQMTAGVYAGSVPATWCFSRT